MSRSSDGDAIGSNPVETELLAPRPHVDVVMSGVTVSCLVDTGSMVSTIREFLPATVCGMGLGAAAGVPLVGASGI